MRIPSLRRIFSNDFKPEMKQFVDQIGILLNGNFEPLYNALNNNLTFSDNFNATVTTVQVTVGADGTPLQPSSFKLSSNQKTVSGGLVIDAFGTNDPNILPTSAPFVSLIQSGDFVTIRNVKGLIPEANFTLKIVCLP